MRIRIEWPDIPALMVAVLLALYGVYLVVVGPLLTTVTPGSQPISSHEPTLAGLVPAFAGALVIFGTVRHRKRLAWAGGIATLLFSLAFVFGIGGALIPLALLLLLSLAVPTFMKRSAVIRRNRRVFQ